MKWNKVNDNENIKDERLVKGKEYIVQTFNDKYVIAEYSGKLFLGLPFIVKAWAEFERNSN